MKEKHEYKTPYARLALFFTIAQPVGLAIILMITFLVDYRSSDYLFGTVTFAQFITFLAVTVVLLNLFVYMNLFPIWVVVNEKGLNYRGYKKRKTMIPWDRFQDVGVLDHPTRAKKRYIFFATEPISNEKKMDLFALPRPFGKHTNTYIFEFDNETYNYIRQYYHGEIKGLESIGTYSV